MKKIIFTAFLLVVLPLVASAQLGGTKELIVSVSELVSLLIKLVGALALLVFFWGLVKYIFAQGNESAKADGKKIMGWGLIALFVMVSVWGLVAFMQKELGLPVNVPGGNSGASATNVGLDINDCSPNSPNWDLGRC